LGVTSLVDALFLTFSEVSILVGSRRIPAPPEHRWLIELPLIPGVGPVQGLLDAAVAPERIAYTLDGAYHPNARRTSEWRRIPPVLVLQHCRFFLDEVTPA